MITARAWLVLGFCCVIAMLDGADVQAMAIAAPLFARELAIAPGLLGSIFSIALAGMALGAFLGGKLADRYGARRMLVASTAFFGGWQLLSACADGVGTLVAARALAGFGLGAASPCFLALAAVQVPPARRARTIGIVWAFFPLGGLVGGLINGWLIEHSGWRDMFVYGGVAPLIVALLLALSPLSPPQPGVALHPAADAPASSAGGGPPLLRFLGLATVFFAIFGILAGLVIWVPWFMAQQGLTPRLGATVLAWHSLGALISFAAGGFLYERFGNRALVLSLLCGAGAIAGLGAGLSLFWTIAAAMLLIGIFLGIAAASALAIGGAMYADARRSGGLGALMAVGRAGQMALPFAIGQGVAAGLHAIAIVQATALLPLAAMAAAILIGRQAAEA